MKGYFLLGCIFVMGCFMACNKPTDSLLNTNQRLLRISLASDPRSLDPRIGIDAHSGLVIDMLFEGLMRFDMHDKLVHAVAQSVDVSADQKTYIFHLRPTYWSNGDEVTAFDFEYSWKKIIDSSLKGAGAYNFYLIKNVKAVVHGSKSINDVGILAIDDKTLSVDLEHPTPYFLEALTTAVFFPVNHKVDKKNPTWSSAVGSAFVCNGPFTLKERKQNDNITVVKNNCYWDKEAVSLPGIKIAIIPEALTQLSMFEKNELELIGKPLSKLPLDAIPTLKKEGKLNHVSSLGVYWYFINTEAFPFNNKKMRQAFSYAINREQIAYHVLQEGETPALGILPPALKVHHKPYFADYNVQEARKLFQEALDELGITKEALPVITLNYNTSEYHQRIAQVIQEEWYQAFGLRINLQQEEWKVHYHKLLSGDFQIGGMTWFSWLKDPICIMQTFRYKNDGINMSQWEHPAYQRLLAATEEEYDYTKRLELFHQAQLLLMEEMPIIPVYFTTICYAQKKSLKNVHVSELNQITFKWAYLDDNEGI